MRLILSMVALLLIVTTPTRAADITLVEDNIERGRTLRLTGPITPGDLDRLKGVIGEVYGPRLLLNSPGGSYAEAIKIADFMLASGWFPTEIESGAQCYSACAIIFLSGNGAEDSPLYPWRVLHKNGSLGFHAPYIPELPGRVYTGQELQTAYFAAVKAIRDLLSIIRKHNAQRGFLPTSLLVEMLTKGPDELFRIDTVYKAIKSEIKIAGYTPPNNRSLSSSCNVCVNSDDLGIDPDLEHPPTGDQAESCMKKRPIAKANEAWFKWHSYDVEEYCVVRVQTTWGQNEGMVLVARQHSDDTSKVMSDEEFKPVDALYLFPPTMRLRDLP